MRPRLFRDELNKTLFFIAVALLLTGSIVRAYPAAATVLRLLGFAAAGFFLFRMFSKDEQRRYRENQRFMTAVTAVQTFFRDLFSGKRRKAASSAPKDGQGGGFRRTWEEYKTYRFLICPQCSQRLRVPKGKGKIRVTCTNCGNKFLAKS